MCWWGCWHRCQWEFSLEPLTAAVVTGQSTRVGMLGLETGDAGAIHEGTSSSLKLLICFAQSTARAKYCYLQLHQVTSRQASTQGISTLNHSTLQQLLLTAGMRMWTRCDLFIIPRLRRKVYREKIYHTRLAFNLHLTRASSRAQQVHTACALYG